MLVVAAAKRSSVEFENIFEKKNFYSAGQCEIFVRVCVCAWIN